LHQTGQDFVRMEEKFKAQRTEIAPVMVVVAANEPVQSADYTSGLVRRRLSMTFRHRPAVPRDLLSWHAGAWHGELASEIPGVLNWVLALPDAQMEALLQQTTTLVPSLQATWAQILVDTNPLAEWANQALIRDARTDPQGKNLAVVNVGRAHKLDQSHGYEHQDRWLYPHYRAWVDDTGGKPLSSRRFTGLLRDLFENQLRLDGVEHRDDNKGSRFCGLRLRTDSDADQPCLITHHPPPVTDRTNPSHPSLVLGVGVTTPVPPVTEALTKDTVILEAGVELMATEGVSQHEMPSQGHVLARGPDTRWAVQPTEMPTGWPLAPCARAAPPATVPSLPCTLCGGMERWDDQGTMRCVTCWTREARRTNGEVPGAVSAPGTTRG
jgi:hypothetical protein